MVTIGVLNEKGGTGKTCLATHLAGAAVLSGQRVLLLDCNSRQGSASDWAKSRKPGSKLEALRVHPVQGALTFPQLQQLGRDVDLVVMDGAPGLDRLSAAAAALSDVLLIPVRPSAYNLWAAGNAVELFREAARARAGLRLRPQRRAYVLTQVLERSRLYREALSALRGADLCPVIIHRKEVYAQMEDTGETVQTLHPGSEAAGEVEELYEYVMGLAREAGWAAPAQAQGSRP